MARRDSEENGISHKEFKRELTEHVKSESRLKGPTRDAVVDATYNNMNMQRYGHPDVENALRIELEKAGMDRGRSRQCSRGFNAIFNTPERVAARRIGRKTRLSEKAVLDIIAGKAQLPKGAKIPEGQSIEGLFVPELAREIKAAELSKMPGKQKLEDLKNPKKLKLWAVNQCRKMAGEPPITSLVLAGVERLRRKTRLSELVLLGIIAGKRPVPESVKPMLFRDALETEALLIGIRDRDVKDILAGRKELPENADIPEGKVTLQIMLSRELQALNFTRDRAHNTVRKLAGRRPLNRKERGDRTLENWRDISARARWEAPTKGGARVSVEAWRLEGEKGRAPPRPRSYSPEARRRRREMYHGRMGADKPVRGGRGNFHRKGYFSRKGPRG